jgi:hypothetical protein
MSLRPLLLAAIVGLLSANASAAVLFSTLGQTQDDAQTITSTDNWWASDFSTGAQASTITSIRAAMGNFDSIAHNIDLALYSDAAGTVGSLVATFSSAAIGANTLGSNNLVFSHAGASLSANTTYWVVVKMQEAIVDNSPYWWLNYSNGVDGGGSFTAVSGTNPQVSLDTGASWIDYGSGNFRMEINGFTAVPEPSRAVLAFAGLFILGFRRRR